MVTMYACTLLHIYPHEIQVGHQNGHQKGQMYFKDILDARNVRKNKIICVKIYLHIETSNKEHGNICSLS
mgnify:CR=1 FL=1